MGTYCPCKISLIKITQRKELAGLGPAAEVWEDQGSRWGKKIRT